MESLSTNYFKILEASRISQMNHKRNRDSACVCLVSEPGLGKTQTVEAYAKSINYHVDSMILGRSTPVDFGIPAPDKESGKLIYYITDRFINCDDIPDGMDGKILFFDEIGSASPDVQVAIQALIQDRKFEGREVDDRIMFVCATNLPEHTGGANDLVKSLASRLLFVMYKFDARTWMQKARTQWGILPEIYVFHAWSGGNKLHMFDPNAKALSNPDPRGWNKVSHTLASAMESMGFKTMSDMYDAEPELVRLIVEGQIGEGISHEFIGFLRTQKELPTVSEVFSSPMTASVPKASDAQHAVVFNIEHALAKQATESKHDRASKRDIDATYDYITRLPRPMAVFAFRRLCESVTKSFTTTAKFEEFRKEYDSAMSIKGM